MRAQSGALEQVSLTPPSGSGEAQVFRLNVADGNSGRDVASVGLYIGQRFDASRPDGACVVSFDVARGEVSAAGARACSVSAAESGATVAGDRVTVAFALRFVPEFAGSKRIWAYSSSAGDTRRTGWKEVGSWLVQEDGQAAEARVGQAADTTGDPDAPTKELDRTDTERDKFVRANPAAAELAHAKGVLRYQLANGRGVAILGPVTHQDPVTGRWVANEPVLSETSQGWRVDGTSNSLIIRKKGLNQHTVTQTYTEFATKHDSTLTLTVPSLLYDKKQAFHFAQEGVTWDMTVDLTGAFNLAAQVAAKQGKKAFTFDVKSSEGLAVDPKGNLIGDGNVKLSRAIMYPKYGKAVACTAWTYSAKDGATFTCDDSGFTAEQLPYLIDPSSHTYTNTGTYYITRWYDNWGNGGGDFAEIDFNTSGLIPTGGSFVSQTCSWDTGDANTEGTPGIQCQTGTFQNAGWTHVEVGMVMSCNPESSATTSAPGPTFPTSRLQ